MLSTFLGHFYLFRNKMSDDKRESDYDDAAEAQSIAEIESESGEERDGDEEENVGEVQSEKPLDDDLDRRNPQYIPKGGSFYEHDNRTLHDEPEEEPIDVEKKKKMWKEPKTGERWLHDQYVENDQRPKTARELVDIYGYDIRNEENAPRARRRRRYGRGPEKYERKWNDEQAYAQRQATRKSNGRRKPEDFPPLQNKEKEEDEAKRSPVNSAWRVPNKDRQRNAPAVQQTISPPRQGSPKPNKSRSDDHIKPFRTEANRVHESPRARAETKPVPKEIQEVTQSMAAASIAPPKPKVEPRVREQIQEPVRTPAAEQQPANRQNPKRYSKLRKNFQGYFPPEECQDLDPREAKAVLDLQQQRAVPTHMPPQRQQDILVSNVNVLPRYPDQFNGNPAFLPGRTILQTIPPPGLSPQGPLPPNLSPQLAGIEIPPQASYVQPPVFMAPEVLNFPSYSTFPANQNRELFQASSGITYYSPEVQAGSVQPRNLPQRRKAAIPIVPPPPERN